MTATYDPGERNIGAYEVRRRYLGGALALAAAVAWGAVVAVLQAPSWWLLGVFFPLLGALEGYIQGRNRFCVYFAHRCIQDVTEEGGNRQRIEDPAEHEADVRRALHVHIQSILGAALLALALYSGVLLVP